MAGYSVTTQNLIIKIPEKNPAVLKTEVTQKIYQKIMGENPSANVDMNAPVENVSWQDAVRFCSELSRTEGVVYRLPTTDEWIYFSKLDGSKVNKLDDSI